MASGGQDASPRQRKQRRTSPRSTSMNKPKCKLCGGRHWSYEEHDLGVTPTVTTIVTPDTDVTIVEAPTNVTGRGFGSGAGRPKKHETSAQRQAAYRERLANLP
jgi:hypothetical protein